MTYRYESQLQNSIECLLPSLIPSTGTTFYRREMPIVGCIPDFVCVTLKQEPQQPLLPHNCSFRHTSVLWLLRKHWRLHPESVASKLHSSLARSQVLLTDLEKSGAVLRHETGAYSLSIEWRAAHCDVLAVEAKLFRWREALEQAISYKSFAHRVVVAMDPLRAPQEEKAFDLFKESGVGLCTVSEKKTTWLIQPRFSRTTDNKQEYVLASALNSLRKTQRLWSFLYE